MCSIQNSTCPCQFSYPPAQNALALSSGRALVSLTVYADIPTMLGHHHTQCWSLAHWGRVTFICISKLTIIGSDNGLSPGQRQAIIWTNDGILWIGLLGINFNEILIVIHTFSFKKIHLKMLFANMAAILSRPQYVMPLSHHTPGHYLNQWWNIVNLQTWQPSCLGLNMLCLCHITLQAIIWTNDGILWIGAVLNKNRTSTHGPRTAPYEFCLPVRGPWSFNACIISLRAPYGFWDPKQPLNSPKQPFNSLCVRGPYGQIRRPCGIFVNFVCINSLTCPQGSRMAPLRVLHGPRMGPVGYEKHWRFPCGARTVPVRASYGAPVESCETFDQTISAQPCQAVQGP